MTKSLLRYNNDNPKMGKWKETSDECPLT